MTEKVAIRGLARLASGFFFVWGGLALAKGLWDFFIGQPEANFFSGEPWQFVTRAQWRRYAAFETTYGLACAALGFFIARVAPRLPEWTERQHGQLRKDA